MSKDFASSADSITDNSASAYTNMVYFPGGGYMSSRDNNSVINSAYATRSGLIVFKSSQRGDVIVQKEFGRTSANTYVTFVSFYRSAIFHDASQLRQVKSDLDVSAYFILFLWRVFMGLLAHKLAATHRL